MKLEHFATLEDIQILHPKSFKDSRGILVPLHPMKEIPFSIARVFYISGSQKGVRRGAHAHKRCHQSLFCPQGDIELTVDDGYEIKKFTLNDPTIGIYIPPALWSSQRYVSDHSWLIVFANLPYDENEYLRDYSEFLQFRGIPQKRAASF